MGSVGIQNSNPDQNQNPFAPYDNYRDCSQGICSIYCPQYCYLIFPPPPPSSDNDSGPPFSPPIIAIVVVLVCAFILASYYMFATRSRNDRATEASAAEEEIHGDESSQDPWGNPRTGLDEALIKKITVCKYQKGSGLIEGTDCAVCLSEFRENESLRLMPKCSHAFHLPCIDTWLKSQSNCPLCRANVMDLTPPPSSVLHMNSSESQRPDDSVITVAVHGHEGNNCDHDGGTDEQMVVIGRDESNVETEPRPPTTAGAFLPPHRHLLISDILKFEEIDEYIKVENDHLWRGMGSSSGRSGELLRSPVAWKKLGAGHRFLIGVQDRGKSSVG